MGTDTNISYCHSTFNPWWGCRHKHSGCDHCWAEAFAKRCGHDCWGDNPRQLLSDHYWQEPLKWNRAAEKAGERRRVLLSMCDPFEDRPELERPRARLFDLIATCHSLDWLLLTKRPENIEPLVRRLQGPGGLPWEDQGHWHDPVSLPNIWLGYSASTQADLENMSKLLEIPAAVWFLSLEPMLEAMSLAKYLRPQYGKPGYCFDINGEWWHAPGSCPNCQAGLGWIVAGGESGPERREFKVEWAESVYEQCKAAGVPFWMKQDSHRFPGRQGRIPDWLWKVKELPSR